MRTELRFTLIHGVARMGVLAFFAVALIIPLVSFGMRGAGSATEFWGAFANSYNLERLFWSLQGAFYTLVCCLALGIPLSYVLARFEFMGKDLLLRFLLLPFVIPAPVAALGWLALFGAQGLLGIDLRETLVLVLLGNIFYNLPLCVRFLHAGFLRVDQRQLEVARLMGLSRSRIFVQCEWPTLKPAVGAAASLTFLYVFSSLGLPLLLGGNAYATLEVRIYSLVSYQLRLGEASALVALEGLVALVLVALYLGFQRQRPAVQGWVPIKAKRPVKWQVLSVWGSVCLLWMALFAPLLCVVYKGFKGSEGLTVAFYESLWNRDDHLPLLDLLTHSLAFGFLGLTGALGVALLQAYVIGRSRKPFWIEMLGFLPLVVSPVGLSVGYLVSYPKWQASLGMLGLAYTLFAYPIFLRTVLPALRNVSPSLRDAARSLGCSSVQSVRRVTWPLVQSAFRTGLALALATIFGEFAASLVLQRPEWATLTLGIYERLGRPGEQNLGEAFALASVLLCLTVLCFSAIDARSEIK